MSTVWTHISDAPPTSAHDLTADGQHAVDDVLDAAQAFTAGELPTAEAARVGTVLNRNGNPSPARTRALAYWHLLWTGQWDSDARRALEALTDTIGAKDYKRLPDSTRVEWRMWHDSEQGVQRFRQTGGTGGTHQEATR